MTYTYSILEVSESTHREIKAKLEGAGYLQALHEVPDLGTVLDMHGIALASRQEDCMSEQIDSTSERRVENNVMRHKYKVLNDKEKADMLRIKDMGKEFYDFCTQLGTSTQLGTTRELTLARTKIEEAVMWAVKHITKEGP